MNRSVLSDSRVPVDQVLSLAEFVLPLLSDHPILFLKGDLGSGKTTFSKTLLKLLGVKEEVTSPTFNIVNEYTLADGGQLMHFDLYRIKRIEELEEIGFFEYLDSGYVCLIEWPDIIEDLMDQTYLQLNIYHLENQRQYVLERCHTE